MNILFLGGDKRYLPIILELSPKNNIDLVGYNTVDIIGNKINNNSIEFSKYDIIILPMNGIKENMKINSLDGEIEIVNNELKKISSKCMIFTGLITNPILAINSKNIISFLDDKVIKDFINDITVEGIIEKIKDKSNKKICILGYGNIGHRLYKKLNQEEIDIVVGEIDENKLKSGLKIFNTKDISEFIKQTMDSDIIINTVPSNILSENIVKNISEKTYILDVASYPHGIDKCLLDKYTLNYDLYLGIPGKYKPEETADILIKKIKDMIGE